MEFYNINNAEYRAALKSSVVFPVFKVELMDYQENVFQEIEQDISTQDSGNINVTYQQGVRRSCSVTLTNIFGQYLPNANDKIWIGTKFKIYIGIRVPLTSQQERQELYNLLYGQEKDFITYTDRENDTIVYADAQGTVIATYSYNTYWFSQGVFLLNNPSVIHDSSKKTITLSGTDKFGIFGSETNFKETEGTYLIPAGTTVNNIIRDILLLNMGNGVPLDSSTPIIDSSIAQETLPYDISKSPETYFSDILIELANIFACDIFYDTEGRLNFVKGNENKNMEQYSSQWDFTDISPEYFSPTSEYDFTNVYNVVKVIGNNPASPIYETVLKNTLESSETRVQLIGEKIKYIESTFCYNSARTADFARYLLRKYAMIQQSFNFSASLIPHLEVNNIITITDDYFKYNQQRFVVQSLTFPLSTTALIEIEATNTANIPYFEY